MRALAPLVAPRRRGVGDTVRITNRLTRPLKHDVPPVRHWGQETDTAICCAVLRRWPTLTAVPRARRATLAPCCRAPHGRSAEGIAPRRHAIKSATPRTTNDGVMAPHALLGQALGAQRRVPVPALAAFDTALAQDAQRPPAFPLVQARPGAGPVFAPRLLVACGVQRECSAAAARHT
jgi:hypothetical protein